MGPSLGNLVNFYGDRDFYALSVSQDPKMRNPAYRPIPNANPDSEIRQMHFQYAVWDAYTADRSAVLQHAADVVRDEVRRHPRVQRLGRRQRRADRPRGAARGAEVRIVVYQLVGGDPLSDAPPEVGT